ncbi:MAG: hypothetical protein RR576_11235 [Oscillospiraceae bacterium]
MLSGVMLIVITMFAVLGAYFLSDVLTSCIFKSGKIPKAIVLLSTGKLDEMWNGITDIRQKNPECDIIVLCSGAMDEKERLEPSMRGVSFATKETIGTTLCARLHLQNANNAL